MKTGKWQILAVFLIVTGGVASAELEGYIVESGPEEVQNLIYTWADSDTTPYFQDAQAYPDVGVMICDSSGDVTTDYFTGVAYSTGSESQLVSYGSDGNLELADNDVTFNGNNCKMTSIGGLTVSPSTISGTPETKIAGMPGEADIMISEASDGSSSQLIESNSQMQGSYSGNIDYDYDTNRLNLDVDQITVESDVGLQDFTPSTDGRGVNSDRPLTVGACSDSNGDDCNGLDTVKTDADFPESFEFDKDAAEVNDQNVYTRYGVANGKLVDKVDIGADLDIRGLSVDRDPVYYSQNQSVSFRIRNTGNVPVTESFSVSSEITRDGSVFDSRSFEVSSGLDPGESESFSYEWEASEDSGQYSVDVEADTDNDIAEINEGETASRGFDLEAVEFPEIYVDGELKQESDTEFEYPGIPYNLTFVMKDSDGEVLDNSLIRITETDGVSSFVPQQEVTDGRFSDMRKVSEFRTDENGTASITFIPTGNVFLSDRYNDTDVQASIDYSVKFTGRHDGDRMDFIIDDSVTDEYPLEVDNPGLYQGEASSGLPNLDTYVKPVMNTVYTIFSEFWGAVT